MIESIIMVLSLKMAELKLTQKDIKNSLLFLIAKLKIDILFITFLPSNIDLIINVIGLEIYYQDINNYGLENIRALLTVLKHQSK